MSNHSIPRLSRPSIAPPTGPLPSLPVGKTRNNNNTTSTTTIGTSGSPSPPASLLPSPAGGVHRSISSALPQRPVARAHPSSTSNVPVLTTEDAPAAFLPAGKTLRKVVSIGSFPQPPKHAARVSSHPPSPLSASSTPGGGGTMPSSQQAATPAKTLRTPSRRSSLQKPPRLSGAGGRSMLAKSPLSPPSLLNGSGDMVPVDPSHLSPPSPPQSRNSSAQDSYATSATEFEDTGEDDVRGRSSSHKSQRSSLQKDGKGNVLVSVRVRPDAGSKDAKQEQEWDIDGKRSLISYRGREGGEYNYDNVFDTQDNNARVYDAAAKRLVRRVMEGYHGTVFAYGMTGTGKTFSMQGTATNPGVIPLAITDIFSYIRETPHREFLLRVSYLEIYNERIHDLLAGPVLGLNGQPGQQEEIKLREDSKRGVYATPLKEEIVQSPTQLLRVIARGDNARRVAGTQFNARSSRSHAVVQIVVESRERVAGSGGGSLKDSRRTAITPGGVRVSTLSLIDLAGSEKAAENKERRTEGSHINKSLLTLGTVIARLSSDKEKAASEKDKGNKDKHLPYRDSKLTRLLQPALSGNSLVSILCTIQTGASGSIAAAHSHTGETLNTLKFASRAKNNIVSHAKKADESLGAGTDAGSRALLDRYRLEIQDLRKQLDEQNKTNKEAADVREERERKEELVKDAEEEKVRELEDRHRHEEQMLEMQLARTALKERIEHLNRLILSSKSLGVNNGVSNSRSFSSMSLQRGSIRSVRSSGGDKRPLSLRSSGSQSTLEVPKRSASQVTYAHGMEGSEEEDSLGENGDGIASQGAQIQALQADLFDKNRYIATLEKRLLQARRSSQSRVSMSLSRRAAGGSDDGSMLAVLAEKDGEISGLRAQLEDKERMIAALTSARKKGETAADLASDSAPSSRRASRQHSDGSGSGSGNANVNLASIAATAQTRASTSPPVVGPCAAALAAASAAGVHGGRSGERNIDDVTRLLDEMISKQVDSVRDGGPSGSVHRSTASADTGSGVVVGGRRGSLMPVSEGLVSG